MLNREGGVSISIIPRTSNVAEGSIITVNIKAKNTQNVDDTFRININVSEIPLTYQANLDFFNWTEKTININSGEERLIPLEISIPEGVSGTKAFRAKIISVTSSNIYSFDTGKLIIL